MAKKTGIEKMKKAKRVQFEFSALEAKKVALAGDFNNWDTGAHQMKKYKNGKWKTVLSLNPGSYEYRFYVDDNWENDPDCTSSVLNDFGSTNCLKHVE